MGADTEAPKLENTEVHDEEKQPKEKNIEYYGLVVVASIILLVAVILFVGAGIAPADEGSNGGGIPVPPPGDLSRSAFVHLFEWRWTDIEKECVNFLGPKGYKAIQVSPPYEHIDHRFMEDFPWWTRYQPVSYRLESRSGNREEFISMVETCKSVGVEIYVDAVINHMAATNPTPVGIGGSPYNVAERSYPDYSIEDFNKCDPPGIQDEDWGSNAFRLRHCELLGLPDLRQNTTHVREKIIGYLQDLIDIGVTGFRFDASRHMEPEDIDFIVDSLTNEPLIYLEVLDLGVDIIKYTEYNTERQHITEFNYSIGLGFTFADKKISSLKNFGEESGLMPSDIAVVFIDNHDNQRGHGSGAGVTHRDGPLYEITNVFMLAHPYGYPKVMSSYEWGGTNDNRGPPHDEDGNTTTVYNEDGSLNCFGVEWKCEHRWTGVANMVEFRNYASMKNAFQITNWWDNEANQIAFSREGESGVAGFVAINREDVPMINHEFETGMEDGKYCNVAVTFFDPATRDCGGNVVTVSNGKIVATIGPISSLAIYGGSKLN